MFTDLNMYNYKFYTSKNLVVAVTTYAGKIVKGKAKCNPEDTFDLEKGKALAAVRCNAKIAKKRVKRASGKFGEAIERYNKALEYLEEMTAYINDAEILEQRAEDELAEVLSDFK